MAYFPWLCQITQGIPTYTWVTRAKIQISGSACFFRCIILLRWDENLCINTSGVRKSQRFGKCLDSIPSGKLTLCYWKLPFIVDLPIKNGWIFPVRYVKLPEGTHFGSAPGWNSSRSMPFWKKRPNVSTRSKCAKTVDWVVWNWLVASHSRPNQWDDWCMVNDG